MVALTEALDNCHHYIVTGILQKHHLAKTKRRSRSLRVATKQGRVLFVLELPYDLARDKGEETGRAHTVIQQVAVTDELKLC